MGHRTTISGHIQEAWYLVPGRTSDDPEQRRIRDLNDAAIASLAERPSPTHLSRDIFAVSRSGAMNAYRGRVFHFGSSIHSFWEPEGDAAEWLKEFEFLLRRMFWEHAQVLVSTEYV